MNLAGKKVVVAGTGKSGIAAAKLLLQIGASVVLFDENEQVKEEQVMGQFPSDSMITLVVGKMTKELAQSAACMVISPGISIEAPFTEYFRNADVPIWSEVELAYRFGKGKLAAITGTNGKTTTTTLVGELLEAYYDSVYVVGNIGTPYTEASLQMKDNTVTVAEISSFQLESIDAFHPQVSAVLNVTPDHLNRHHTMEIYADTKMEIAANQTADEICVLNYDDELTRAMADRIKAKPLFFSRLTDLADGICLQGDSIVMKQDNQVIAKVCERQELKLLGEHNIENVMAGIAIAYYMGVPLDIIHNVVVQFKAVEHRIEYVDTIEGVDYYNDSKGTNPDAAIKGIQAMVKPTVLIAGGYDKKVAFDEWIQAFGGKVRSLILIGVTAPLIAETAKKYDFHDIIMAASLEDAVKKAYEQAKEGDAVLLSPACASWDMFDSYEQRGELFKQYVGNLKG